MSRRGPRLVADADKRESLYSSLHRIDARVWLTELSRALGRPATLHDIPDAELDQVARMGFDWVWLLSVWRTGPAGQRVSRASREWRREFQETLPDLREEDIAGSGFAITGYTVHPGLGGDAALARLRERLEQRGLSLMLDFVPNHTGLDHPWVEEHPAPTSREPPRDPGRLPRDHRRGEPGERLGLRRRGAPPVAGRAARDRARCCLGSGEEADSRVGLLAASRRRAKLIELAGAGSARAAPPSSGRASRPGAGRRANAACARGSRP